MPAALTDLRESVNDGLAFGLGRLLGLWQTAVYRPGLAEDDFAAHGLFPTSGMWNEGPT